MSASTSATPKLQQPPPAQPAAQTGSRFRRPNFSTVVLLIPVVYMTVVYAIPVGRTLVQSVLEPTPGFGNFADAFSDPIAQRVVLMTLRISAEVAIICLLLGFPVAYFMSRLPPRRARLVALLVIIPFWTSVLVRSFAWIVLLGDDGVVAKMLSPITGSSTGLLYSEPAVVIAMVHVLLPFTILIIKSTLDQIDSSLMRAARTLGAGPIRAFTKIYLPLATPAAVSGTMLVFIMSLGYYITPALVGGPKQTMIAMLIERKINVTFDWPGAATMSTLLLIVSVVLYVLVRKVTKVRGLVGTS